MKILILQTIGIVHFKNKLSNKNYRALNDNDDYNLVANKLALKGMTTAHFVKSMEELHYCQNTKSYQLLIT